MVVLGILAATLVLALAWSVQTALCCSFPESYTPRAEPLENLPAEDASAIEGWGRALEAAGFARIGDFRVDIPLGRPDGVLQVEQKRVWLSPDRTIWASAKRLSVLNPSMDGNARAWRMLGFSSPLASGGVVSTHNSPVLDSSFLRDPQSSTRVWPGLEDVDLLLAAHRRHLEERGAAPLAPVGDLPAFEQAAWRRTTELSRAQGYLVLRDGRLYCTWKLALRSAFRGLNPFLLERGSRAAIGARLAALAVTTSLAAVLLGDSPWGIAALFGAAAAVACFLFPQSHLISWGLTMLPAHLILDARGAPAGWGWLAGAAAAVLVLGPLEKKRYRRAAAALARPVAGPPPLSPAERRAWTAGIIACALAGAALLVWLRAPKQPGFATWLALCVGAVSLTGILTASLVVGLIRSLKDSAVKRTLDTLAACALLLLGGLLGGAGLGMQDAAASDKAADEITARLEAHRTSAGAYPASLAELGAHPMPRCGWRDAAFGYAALDPQAYRLTWPSWQGLRWREVRP